MHKNFLEISGKRVQDYTKPSLFQKQYYDSLIKEFDGFSQQIEIEIKENKDKNVDYLEYETIVGPYIYYEPVSGDDFLILKGSPEVVVKASIRIGEIEYLMGKDFDYFEKLSLKIDTKKKNSFNFTVETEYIFKNLSEKPTLRIVLFGKRFKDKEKVFHYSSFEIIGTKLFKDVCGKGLAFSERIEDLGEFQIHAHGIGQIKNMSSIISNF